VPASFAEFYALQALWPPDSCLLNVRCRASNRKPTLEWSTAGIIEPRAPVAQWIVRRPPEPDRLSVVAALVGPRAKRAEFYALREALRGFARPPVFRLLAWRHTFKPMLRIAKADGRSPRGVQPAACIAEYRRPAKTCGRSRRSPRHPPWLRASLLSGAPRTRVLFDPICASPLPKRGVRPPGLPGRWPRPEASPLG